MDQRIPSDKVKHVLLQIRALLTSAKNGLCVEEIQDDYKQIEGHEIPLNAIGYSSVELLLRDSNQFIFIETKQGTRVMSKPSKDAYVTKSAPNSPSKGKKKSNMMPPQRALRSTTDNHWNGTAYSQAYTQMPNRSVKKTFTHPAKLLQAAYNNGGTYRPILKQSNIKQVPKDDDELSNRNPMPQAKPFPMRTAPNQMYTGPPNLWMNQRNMDRVPKKPTETPPTKSSVQSRLAIQKSISADTVDFVQTQSMLETQDTPFNDAITQKMKSIRLEAAEPFASIAAISLYCQQKGYSEPQYSFSRTKARKFTCKVTVGPAIYASYPNEFNTQMEAQNEAARIAYESITEMEYREKYPMCMDTTTEIANKIVECISENGVFLKFIPQLFQEKYDIMLPDGWMHIIEDNPHLFSVAKDALMDRVYPNLPSGKDAGAAVQQKSNELELVLPWNDRHWNIFVTSVSTTVDIWGRLIGPDYSAKLDSILDDIETELVSGGSKTVCTDLSVGKLCYITNPDCYRVRIEKIDEGRKLALCFLIDYGDEEWWSLHQIYEGDPKLFQLPPQAIRFSLFNLEDFAENPQAKQEVDEYLAGKTLIAEVKSTQAEYVAQCESPDLDGKIKAVFYDTSSEEDVQLNKVILDKICAKVQPPQLQRSKWNPVCVSHVSDSGEIYVQLHNDKVNTVHNIKQLIHRLTQNGINTQFAQLPAKLTASDLSANELYLIQDNSDLKWYRAAILPKMNGDNTCELCKYVDYGMTKYVPRENIYRLDLLSAALSKYPHQAILVRLHDVTTYNPKIVARLRGLLCSGAVVLAQVVGVTSMVPMVDICKRLENNILCKINDTIRMEQEIESSELLVNSESTFPPTGSGRALQTKDDSEIRLYPEPPLDKFFNVVVVTAPSPSNFFVRPCCDEAEFKSTMMHLRRLCETSAQRVHKNEVKVGEYYAGLMQDGYWYRVKIQNIIPGDMVIVYKCDFGDITFLSIDALRPLSLDFRRMPQLAISATLHGIQPRNNIWNNDDSSYFQKLTVQKQFATEVKAIRKDPGSNHGYVLEMVLIDVSTQEDININEDLVKKQHANYI